MKKLDKVIDPILIVAMVVCVTALIVSFSARRTTEAAYEPTTEPTTAETTEYITEPTKTEVQTEESTEPTEATKPYTDEELEMMALVIYQEAGGDACSDETRLMVGTVVMNRVADSRFPDTLYEVLTQKRQYGRLHWTGLVWPDRANNPGESHAVERAYKCAEQILSGYRSFDTDVIWQAEFSQGSEIVAYQDGMYFCK